MNLIKKKPHFMSLFTLLLSHQIFLILNSEYLKIILSFIHFLKEKLIYVYLMICNSIGSVRSVVYMSSRAGWDHHLLSIVTTVCEIMSA